MWHNFISFNLIQISQIYTQSAYVVCLFGKKGWLEDTFNDPNKV